MDQHEPVIERVLTPSPDLVEAFERLLPQLSDDVRPDVEEGLVRALAANSNYLLVARVGGRIVGVLTLVVFHIPTATKAWIEDVVVDGGARRSGIGEALVKAGIEMAVEAGARAVDLTSRRSRETANRLYRRMGFEIRDTNLLRFAADTRATRTMDEPNQVLLLTGPPGAGKTTVARLLAQRNERAVHLESDRFFESIVSGYVAPWLTESHGQNEVVMRIVGDAAASYAAAGYFTIVDGIMIPGWFFEPLRDQLASRGFDVAYAVLRPSLATALARARARTSKALPDDGAVEQLWTAFSDLGSLEAHVIDNDGFSAEQTADRLAGALGGHVRT